MTATRPRLRFPRLRRVEFETFSLFAQQPNVKLPISSGVTCLAGANGIGKSTFLAAVNFALTGRVPLPDRSYSSADEYFRDSSFFPRQFFEGRIRETDRATASISIEVEIDAQIFQLSRGLFDPDGLRSLTITDNASGVRSFDGSSLSDTERQQAYATRLTELMGLKSFDQFVFLQHFVFTFDESRNLLFWNTKALEAALFIAFGTKPEQQATADSSRREMERAESLGRNVKWQALHVRKRIDSIREALGPASSVNIAELEGRYAALESAHSTAVSAAEEAESKAADCDLSLANATALLLALRREYGEAFARHVGGHSAVAEHPTIVEGTTEHHCAICGTTGVAVSNAIREQLEAKACPLCATSLASLPGQAVDLVQLRELDKKIASARERMESASATRDRLSRERDEARQRVSAAAAALRQFEEANTEVVKRVQGTAAASAGAEEELGRLASELATLLQASKDHYQSSKRHKTALQKLQAELEQHYKAAEEEFVPLFRKLAEHFIGIELDIASERRTSGFALVLELKSTRRRDQQQLSESQRFFLDIALRMALTQFISTSGFASPLYIDTPEGSLDIAYEARAGEMFAEFVKDGHDLIMTANINTSQLLRKLAAKCGSARMTLVRMTEWTDLSDVQLQEESLFRDAYSQIESDLQGQDAQ